MIKSELIQRIADQKPHLYKRQVEIIVDTILGKVTSVLSAGGRVEIRGFGVFSAKTWRARIAHNPKTGKRVAVSPKRMPLFSTGKEMRQRLNGDTTVDFVKRPLFESKSLEKLVNRTAAK